MYGIPPWPRYEYEFDKAELEARGDLIQDGRHLEVVLHLAPAKVTGNTAAAKRKRDVAFKASPPAGTLVFR